MPNGANSSARAKAIVDWPVASATIADSRWELSLLYAQLAPGVVTNRRPRMWRTQSRLWAMRSEMPSLPPTNASSPASPEVMVNSCFRVTWGSRGSAVAGRWSASSSSTVWSRLRSRRSRRAMPTSAETKLLVTKKLLWPSLAATPCQ
jgi:hypothetical protein